MSNSSFYDFHCPKGGQWYACDAQGGSNFVGCCTNDPCSIGCQQGDIRPGGYNASHHGEFAGASCEVNSDFYTCGFSGTFWGCCKTDPCKATPGAVCPTGDLVPAFMGRPEQFSTYGSNTTSATPSASSTPDDKKSNTGPIVGGVVGGVVGLAIIGLIIFFVLRKRRNQKPAEGDMGAAAMVPMMNNEKHDHNRHSSQFHGQSPPPTYSAPIQGSYQDNSPNKGHQSYHQYASHASEPQELPAEVSSSNTHRYSELPAGASNDVDTRRFSELPADASGPAPPSELESPQVSPRPVQTGFSNDMAKRASQGRGLGVMTEEGLSQRN
ncbi:hypothetical protein ACET3X_005481 [Alternaria dauci]|uniref:Uncharacterized protein n=1 Tax=Alternaria dauci TaxID=48095 RepID=A0ABR3UN61_9PLEO